MADDSTPQLDARTRPRFIKRLGSVLGYGVLSVAVLAVSYTLLMAQSRSRTGQMRESDIYLAVLALLALPHMAIVLWVFLGRVRWSLIVAAVLAVAGAGSVPLIWGF